MINMIRGARARFQGVPIIFVPENEPGDAGPQYETMVRNEMPLVTMREYGSAESKFQILGVPRKRTADMYARGVMNEKLGQGFFMFSSRFFTLDPEDNVTTDLEHVKTVKEIAQNQMRSYKGMQKVRKNEYENNDLMVAMSMLFYWPTFQFFKFDNPEYRKFYDTYIGKMPITMH